MECGRVRKEWGWREVRGNEADGRRLDEMWDSVSMMIFVACAVDSPPETTD